MSSVMEIESAIRKLSIDEQRIIALHLGERLEEEDCSGGFAAANEGIRFLPPYESCPIRRESRRQKLRRRARARAGR